MRQFITAAAMLAAAMLSTSLALADPGNGNGGVGNGRGNGNEKHEYHGAPGPVIGAGLPVLAIGYGVYWLVKRRRRAG